MERSFLTIFGAVLPDSATRAGINAGLTASPQAFKVSAELSATGKTHDFPD